MIVQCCVDISFLQKELPYFVQLAMLFEIASCMEIENFLQMQFFCLSVIKQSEYFDKEVFERRKNKYYLYPNRIQ